MKPVAVATEVMSTTRSWSLQAALQILSTAKSGELRPLRERPGRGGAAAPQGVSGGGRWYRRSGENRAWIEDPLRVEGRFDRPHRRHPRRVEVAHEVAG